MPGQDHGELILEPHVIKRLVYSLSEEEATEFFAFVQEVEGDPYAWLERACAWLQSHSQVVN